MCEKNRSSVRWRKSDRSATHNCVEVAPLPRRLIGVRDSKNKTGSILVFTSAEWSAFVNDVKNGSFDVVWPFLGKISSVKTGAQA
ncbi:MAG: DUF397 domain-containing protein [Streptosporangiales bacterium]|nr:DUF397 domain-containing protein [Streptosporangiales bacterium]